MAGRVWEAPAYVTQNETDRQTDREAQEGEGFN